MFARYVQAVPVTDEEAGTIARIRIDEYISLLRGLMERMLLNRGPSLIREITTNRRSKVSSSSQRIHCTQREMGLRSALTEHFRKVSQLPEYSDGRLRLPRDVGLFSLPHYRR